MILVRRVVKEDKCGENERTVEENEKNEKAEKENETLKGLGRFSGQ